MGTFGDKDAIVMAALRTGGAFDDSKEINKDAVYGTVLGSCIGSGKKWTLEDSIKLEATIKKYNNSKKK